MRRWGDEDKINKQNTMRIRIVSPSAAIDPHYIDGAKAVLESWGHTVSIGKYAKGAHGGSAGTQEERLEDLNNAFADPETDAILCSRGGYGLAQIIDRVQLPAEKQKLLIGFSDITCLHNLLEQTDTPSLHAIMAKHIARLPEGAEALTALRQTLEGAPIRYTVAPHPLNRTGKATGRLRGGNLSVMYGLQGTPLQVNTRRDTILFIEDIGEPHHAIDRMLQNLRLSGILPQLQGLIVGQFTDCQDDPRFLCTIQESVRQAVEPYGFPVVFGFPAGHVDLNLPMMMNAPCTIEVTEDCVRFEQEGIRTKE